jgi:hypothetical protein
MILASGERRGLREGTELPIGSPQACARDVCPYLRQERGRQLGLVGLAIGMRGHRYG